MENEKTDLSRPPWSRFPQAGPPGNRTCPSPTSGILGDFTHFHNFVIKPTRAYDCFVAKFLCVQCRW
jgi:hypothetical protein